MTPRALTKYLCGDFIQLRQGNVGVPENEVEVIRDIPNIFDQKTKSSPAHGKLPLVGLGHVFPSDGVKSPIREPLLGEGGQQTHIEDVIEHEERDDEQGKLPEQPVLAGQRMHEALPDWLIPTDYLISSCHTSPLVVLILVLLRRRSGISGNPDVTILCPFWGTHWLYVWPHPKTTIPIFLIYYIF